MRRWLLVLIVALLAPISMTGAQADELVVVLYNDLGIQGDMNAPWTEADESPDHLASSNGQSTYLVRTIKAHLRHFLENTDLNGSAVRVTAVASGGGLSSPCEQRRGEASIIGAGGSVDAVVPLGSNQECFVESMADRYGVMSFGMIEDAAREQYLDRAGLVWSFEADREERASETAAFICRSLYSDETGSFGGGSASFASDPDLLDAPRRFGLIYPEPSLGSVSRGPQAEEYARLVQALTRERCGLLWGNNGPNYAASFRESDGWDPAIMTRFKANGVTTVICYCVPVMSELTTTKMVAAARAINYHPEYFWDHTSRMDKPVWQRYYGPRMPEASFGVTKYWMMPALEQQEHYQAYLSQEPGTEPNERFSFDIYWSFWTLFTAIERSGGDFTPDGVSEGMLGYEVRSNDPTRASGGFTGDNPYTFLDGSMAWWFDPLGEEPGIDLPIGCSRAQGARIYDGAWPYGDQHLYSEGAECWAGPHRAGLTP